MITLVGALSLAQWYEMCVLWRGNPQCDRAFPVANQGIPFTNDKGYTRTNSVDRT